MSADKATDRNLEIRFQLRNVLIDAIDNAGWTQSEAADILNTTQPRISDLITGKIEKFTIDSLVNMCQRIDININVDV